MKWQDRRTSSNVEDRRGTSSGMGGKGYVGVGGILGIIIMIIYFLMGGNPGDLQQIDTKTQTQSETNYQGTDLEEELREFSSVVLADTEDVWTNLFQEQDLTYQKPTLVIYNGTVTSACGMASSQTGPFYCPGDGKIYLDLSFYNDLKNKYQAPGDFALAYVIAHEVGHHVQTQLGITDQVMALQRQLSQKDFNQYMVRFELQADYFAGVFAHHIAGMGYLEQGDIEEAVNAAGAVGDDRIQKQTMGYAVPDTFTHGTSEQRMTWFKKGFETGTIEGGDTFNTNDL